MDRRTLISPLRILSLLFITASIYLWVAIPIICVMVAFAAGAHRAQEIKSSLIMLQPVGIFFSQPDRTPLGFWASLAYFLEPAGDLIAFTGGCVIGFCVRKRPKILAKFFIYLITAFAVSAIVALLRGDLTASEFPCGYVAGGMLPFVACLSGIIVVRLVLQWSLSQTKAVTEEPHSPSC